MSKNKKNNNLSIKSERIKNNYNHQSYFDKHNLQIPEGCRACGGLYPECKSSCPMFDD